MTYQRVQKSIKDSSTQMKQSRMARLTISNEIQAKLVSPPRVMMSSIPIKAQREAIRRSMFGHQAEGVPIQTKLTIGEPGDKYEQEADRVAAEVVNQINAPGSQQSSQNLQRNEISEEEKLMMKPKISTIQSVAMPNKKKELQMKPTLQLQGSNEGVAATAELESSIQQARSDGKPLVDNIKNPMEQAFGVDFSQVKVHTDSQADQLNRTIQARAFTTKQDVFFRQGEYNPQSRSGQELLAHELTHVVQQNAGRTVSIQRVKASSSKKTQDATSVEKLKGEDYANNVQKLIDEINDRLPGFLDDTIASQLQVINDNRSKCTISSSLVLGEDTNNQEYGDYKDNIVKEIEKVKPLIDETNKKYFTSEWRQHKDQIIALFDELPQKAVDERVSNFIKQKKVSIENQQEKQKAIEEIDTALSKLSQALTNQLKAYFGNIYNKNFSPSHSKS
ncbi:DUF4157 domain-containing protein [Scytonema sp. NUACC26]|uniref:eCIS core domain-containing protein n=1 Tax=Scytonema sp. NUACC26 TaxID=3140176 RepID=UPI0034DCC21C